MASRVSPLTNADRARTKRRRLSRSANWPKNCGTPARQRDSAEQDISIPRVLLRGFLVDRPLCVV